MKERRKRFYLLGAVVASLVLVIAGVVFISSNPAVSDSGELTEEVGREVAFNDPVIPEEPVSPLPGTPPYKVIEATDELIQSDETYSRLLALREETLPGTPPYKVIEATDELIQSDETYARLLELREEAELEDDGIAQEGPSPDDIREGPDEVWVGSCCLGSL